MIQGDFVGFYEVAFEPIELFLIRVIEEKRLLPVVLGAQECHSLLVHVTDEVIISV